MAVSTFVFTVKEIHEASTEGNCQFVGLAGIANVKLALDPRAFDQKAFVFEGHAAGLFQVLESALKVLNKIRLQA